MPLARKMDICIDKITFATVMLLFGVNYSFCEDMMCMDRMCNGMCGGAIHARMDGQLRVFP